MFLHVKKVERKVVLGESRAHMGETVNSVRMTSQVDIEPGTPSTAGRVF